MLPLWIIDLNGDTNRCQLFQQNLRDISGALLGASYLSHYGTAGEETSEAPDTDRPIPIYENGQWYYSHFDNPFADADLGNEEEIANLLYSFKEKIVAEGQRFIELLRNTKKQTDISINICVLGHIEEQLTQMTFTSVAAILQLEKGRILPNHIHQGVSIMGMLFIPSAVNTRKREARQRILRCLREIEVQHDVSSVHGYDRMMLYQDVQNKTQKFYPKLNVGQQVDYLTQCIVNLFYATNTYHPLLNGNSADDHFYISLGPTSIYYDPKMQDEKDRTSVANGIISEFKADGKNDKADNRPLVYEKDYDTTKVLCKIFSKLNLYMDIEPKAPDPHPIRDFMYKPLKRRYYQDYLAQFPSMLMTKINESIAEQTHAKLEEMSLARKEMMRSFIDVTMPDAIKQELSDCNQDTGAIARIERKLVDLKNRLAKKQKLIEDTLDTEIWPSIFEKIPDELSDHFNDYHDEYKEDISVIHNHRQTTAERCESRKKEAVNDLVNHIKQEPTTLSRFARVFLYGIVLVLFIIPILELVSPQWINLGNVTRNSFFWATGIFILPTLWQIIAYFIYRRKLRFYVTRLKAFYLHDAYARLVNAVQAEATLFYDKAKAICEEYEKRCASIRNDITPYSAEEIAWKPAIPKMTFNQPLVDGVFGEKHLFPGEYVDYSKVLVSQKTEYVNLLKSEDYYSLIRVLKDQMYLLFGNINLPDFHERKVDEVTGHNVFLSVKEMAELKEERWKNTINDFKKKLDENIKHLMVPRQLNTVDSKVLNYADTQNKPFIMEPLLDFCSTNGELTADNCTEYADVKFHDEKLKKLIMFKLPFNTFYQADQEDELYSKFFFLTKWRCYDNIAANRILPEIDLDLSAPIIAENDEDEAEETIKDIDSELFATQLPYSSLFLYALCGKDSTASLWLKLFKNEDFAKIADKSKFIDQLKSESRIFNKTLNQLD